MLERKLSLTDISTELELRKEVLSNLGFNINRVSQGKAFYDIYCTKSVILLFT